MTPPINSSTTGALTLIPEAHSIPATGIDRSIAAINAPLSEYLSHVGLPTADLLSPIEERRRVIQTLAAVLEILPIESRERATYLSKFTICVTMGLFDGALLFLWDETIRALRNKVIGFDLAYFYSVATSINSRYRGLADGDDILAVGEHDLLEICRRIGLIDDVNHRRLAQVNFFRNHASAAHPNDHNVSGIELLGYLESCLKYAICAPVEHSAVQVKRLLDNIRQHLIPAQNYSVIWSEIGRLQPQRIGDLLQALFGMFCDPGSAQTALENIRGLASGIWPLVSDEVRSKLGAKYGYYRVNGEVPRQHRVQEFLQMVGGNAYKDEDSLGAELIEKLQFLRSAHYGMNNFYNEFPHARSIEQSLPPSGVPRAAKRDFVKVISTCFIGNGYGRRDGVDESAVPYYERFIARFDEADIMTFVTLFADSEFTGDLFREKARQRAVHLTEVLRNRTRNVLIQSALETITGNAAAIANVKNASAYKRAVETMMHGVSSMAVS